MEEGSSEAAVQDGGALSATSVGTAAIMMVVRKSVKRGFFQILGLGAPWAASGSRRLSSSPPRPPRLRRCPALPPNPSSPNPPPLTSEGWRGEPQQPQQQQSQPQPQVDQQQPQKQAQPVMRRAASIAPRQAAMAQQAQETNPVSPKIKRQASAKGGPAASVKPAAAAASTAKPDENPKKSEAKVLTLFCEATAASSLPMQEYDSLLREKGECRRVLEDLMMENELKTKECQEVQTSLGDL
ncbi:hypothetical protein ZWY2020_029416 [Hordeum vulgare]|nr:hypothetical protein ZWY2020_029416 [Hordeum vulgare]